FVRYLFALIYDCSSFPTRRSSDLIFSLLLLPFTRIYSLFVCGLIQFVHSIYFVEPNFNSLELLYFGASFGRLAGWAGAINVPFADRKSTRLKSSHVSISYDVLCL